jgi:non-ribosomal peptide synthetase component F
LTQQLKTLAQSSGGTLYLTLVAAWAMILSRYTGCDDVIFGTTYSNRHHWRFGSLIGATIDVPAIRVDLTDNPTLAALLARVRAVVAETLTHQDVPFEKIGPSLERKTTGPLFRMVFSYFAEVPHGRLQLPGVKVEFLEERINDISRPDLYLVFWENQTENGAALTGYWMHKKNVFENETAEKMNRELDALLSAMVSNPAQTVRELLSQLESDQACRSSSLPAEA